jgi:Undecaprenyl-phosphate glucose phosphotransferase
MLKERRGFFEFFFIVADLLVVILAWFFAFWFRFESGFFELDKGVPDLKEYATVAILIIPLWALSLKFSGLYKPMRGVGEGKERAKLLYVNSIAVVLLITMIFLFREKTNPFSRAVFAWFWLASTFGLILERTFLRFFLKDIRRKGYNLRYVLLIGGGAVAEEIALRIRNRLELGIQLVGVVTKDDSTSLNSIGVPIVGTYNTVKEVLTVLDLDQVFIALPLEDNHLLPLIMDQLSESLVDIKIIPDVFQFFSLGGTLEEFEGLPVIGLQVTPIEGFNLLLKRSFDVIGASFLLIILFPLFTLAYIFIKITSSEPVFYSQERVSLDGSKFMMLKFRSMRTDAESNGPGWTKPGDERITPFGRFLRATSLDELPQIINVLRGEMSFVGPRPERPIYISEFRRRIPKYMLRHKVPAGMTGLAQVNGWRGDTSIDKRIECDLRYIENWSFILDIKILFLTIFKGVWNKNAY